MRIQVHDPDFGNRDLNYAISLIPESEEDKKMVSALQEIIGQLSGSDYDLSQLRYEFQTADGAMHFKGVREISEKSDEVISSYLEFIRNSRLSGEVQKPLNYTMDDSTNSRVDEKSRAVEPEEDIPF